MIKKNSFAILCIVGMMVGFLVSKVALSISMFLFCVQALWGVPLRRWKENRYWLLGLAWVAFIGLSWFWSVDKARWDYSFQVKLPFLIFPVACGLMRPFTARQLQWITLLMGAALFAGAVYSLSFLATDLAGYLDRYRRAELLPTLCAHDHVRFSMAVALYVTWCIYAWQWLHTRWVRGVTIFLVAFFVLFLHVLAAKSGLVAFYLFLLCWGVYLAFTYKKWVGILLLASIPLGYMLAIRFIPTFAERRDYISYSWTMLREGDRSGKYGDVGRLMSYNIAVKVIAAHPWAGVGAGDVMQEMKKGYDRWYPAVDDKARLVPHNQFLMVAMGCGIPAALVFAAWAFYPLTWVRRNRRGFFTFVVWLILLTQLLIEPVLEVQYGVFLYLFFLLWFRQEMPGEDSTI